MPSFEEDFFREPPTEVDEEARRAQEIRQLLKDEFLRSSLEDQRGRLFFWDQLTACHMFENRFFPGQSDATAFALGERNIGLSLLAEIMRISPRAYVMMAEENAT